ncbi:hypothetical protein ILYODFUR_014866 [Ilyodon furcidens]|uniref:Uncharacterized protein n=1 Tax=Ilyodon furcidens TaxID=33524 RepID=A0ABV0SYE6_9TELE
MGNKQTIFTNEQLDAYQDCTFFTRKEILRECEEQRTCPPGPETDKEEIRATDIQRPTREQDPRENHCWDCCIPPHRRAGESPRGTTQQPQCRSPREVQRRAHRPRRQRSTPEQVQPWIQTPETPGNITPQAEARQSPGAQAQASSYVLCPLAQVKGTLNSSA